MSIILERDVKKLLETLTKEDREYIEKKIVEFNNNYKNIKEECSEKKVWGVSVDYTKLSQYLKEARARQIKEIEDTIPQEKIKAAFTYFLLDRKTFKVFDDSRNIKLEQIGFEEIGGIYCDTINGHNITEFFSPNYDMPIIKSTLFELMDLLPSSTKNYLKTKLKEKKDRDSVGVSEITNDFQYMIFENSLPNTITQTKIKSLVKGFRGNDLFLTNITYLIKAVITKYSNQSNFQVIMEELKTNVGVSIYEDFSFYGTDLMSRLNDTKKISVKTFLKILREDEEVVKYIIEIMSEKELEPQTEVLIYSIEDSVENIENKTKLKDILNKNYNSKLTDKFISYKMMTQEEKVFMKNLMKKQFVEQNRELF